MRKGLVLPAAAAALMTFSAADTGANARHAGKAYLCWTAWGGYTDCDWLPAGYHIAGVRRPNCRDVPHNSDRSEFVLTRRQIRALAAQGVRIDTMASGA